MSDMISVDIIERRPHGGEISEVRYRKIYSISKGKSETA
jgi:hypothetical protein